MTTYAIDLTTAKLIDNGCRHELVQLEDGPAMLFEEVTKLDEFDADSWILVDGIDFHDGTISCKMRGDLAENAPEYVRGFLGLAFRVQPETFESLYYRPTNGRGCEDAFRAAHAVQYFSYPDWRFDRFRKEGVDSVEAPADVALGEWEDLKAVVKGDRCDLYVNGAHVLSIDGMKMGADARGGVGIWVGEYTECYVRDLVIECED